MPDTTRAKEMSYAIQINSLQVLTILLCMTLLMGCIQQQQRSPYGYGQSPVYEANRQLTEL